MVGAAIKGISKILRKGLRKAPILGKRVRGTPTKAGLVARKAALRGVTREAPRGVRGVKAPERPSYRRGVIEGGISGASAAYLLTRRKAKKEAKAKESKEKLKKSTEEHKKKTKEKRRKYGKHQD